MTAIWVGSWLAWTLKGSLLLGLMMILARSLHQKSSGASRYAWLFCGLASFLVIPLIELLPDLWSIAVPAPDSVPLAFGPEVARAHLGGSAGEGNGMMSQQLWWLVLSVWMAGSLIGLVGWVRQLFFVKHLRRTSKPLEDAAFQAHAWRIQKALGIRKPVAILLSDVSTMPRAWGPPGRMVILPEGALGWSEQMREMVLSHEMAHCARWDTVTANILRFVRIVQWFNPWVWWAHKQAAYYQELAADEKALSSGQSPIDYSEALVHFARCFQKEDPHQAPMMTLLGTRSLKTRVQALLKPRRPRFTIAWNTLIHGTAIGLVMIFASLTHSEKLGVENHASDGVGDPLLQTVLQSYMANVKRGMKPVTSLPNRLHDLVRVPETSAKNLFFLNNQEEEDLTPVFQALGLHTEASQQSFVDLLRKSQEENKLFVIKKVVR